jgi:hypothetical protein
VGWKEEYELVCDPGRHFFFFMYPIFSFGGEYMGSPEYFLFLEAELMGVPSSIHGLMLAVLDQICVSLLVHISLKSLIRLIGIKY